MSEYDEESDLNIGALILNILTVIVLLVALCIGTVFFTIFINPQSSLNPFPPPTLPPTRPPPTATPVPRQTLPPTFTPEPPTETPVPTITPTEGPTLTPSPSPTLFVLISQTPVAITEPPDTSNVAFELKGDILAIQNFARQDLGCNWMGVAGHAFDLSGNVLTGITVQLGGSLAGTPVDILSLTGTAPQYGSGGYEFTLADRPIASTGTLFIQLLDQTGLPLSDQVFLDTFEDCERNLILVDFQQFR
ncbi:MAG: hypothetical protein R3335_13725 [Anaerolineales bacterium]|nr:hypothetical protein [Anaerolineales bacterium]